MNPRRVWTWIIFWAGVLIVIAALSWASVSVLHLEERNAEVRAMAQRQELIQRALWRIDSRIAPIIALEASRPYSEYEQLQAGSDGQWLRRAEIESGLEQTKNNRSYATKYFQFDSDSMPPANTELAQIAEELSRDHIGSSYAPDPDVDALEMEMLDGADTSLTIAQSDQSTRQQQMGYDYEARKAMADIVSQNTEPSTSRTKEGDPQKSEYGSTQKIRKRSAGDTRIDRISETNEFADKDDFAEFASPPGTITNRAGAQVGGFTPKWILKDDGTEQLVLVRTVTIQDQSLIQGVWLDWPAMNIELVEAIADILPHSSIVPLNKATTENAYPLATIPAAFIPGGNATIATQRFTPALVAMLVTWMAILVSVIAIGVVLRAALNLSDRRGRFVTAVTHELRTPLTTFRLYSQMLADGMVPDESVREQYLTTLKRESERLTGIVENVLEYARLSRRRHPKDKPAGVQTLTPDALLVRFRPTLSRRAAQSNMDLVTSIDLSGHEEHTVTVDPNAVERIMMNLVENACKYAAPADDLSPQAIEEFDTRIHLDVTVANGMLKLLIADHGTGIEPRDRDRIFGEFQRGSRRQILNRSGLGLGLALSRGLAREMGGELQLVIQRAHGAEFLLTIPLDAPPNTTAVSPENPS